MLAKVKSQLQAQLSEAPNKSICDHKTLIDIRNAIELLASMIEMANGLPYKHDDNKTTINLLVIQLNELAWSALL